MEDSIWRQVRADLFMEKKPCDSAVQNFALAEKSVEICDGESNSVLNSVFSQQVHLGWTGFHDGCDRKETGSNGIIQ